MPTLVDLDLSADAFVLEHLLESVAGVRVELEVLVPVDPAAIPLFWVASDDPDAVDAALRADASVADASLLVSTGEWRLYEATWEAATEDALAPIAGSGTRVQRATADPDGWTLCLLFRSREDVARFVDGCRSRDVDVDLRRVSDPSRSPADDAVSDRQAEILRAAYEHGYWEVPRGITLAELADEVGVSNTAVSEALRRGIDNLVAETLVGGRSRDRLGRPERPP